MCSPKVVRKAVKMEKRCKKFSHNGVVWVGVPLPPPPPNLTPRNPWSSTDDQLELETMQ